MGVKVHICHTAPLDANCNKMQLKERGCVYHQCRDWSSLAGMHCISFCNGQFLNNLREIYKYARTTTFVNCMTWNFPKEIYGQSQNLIDFHLYQTQHAFERVSPKLKDVGKAYRPLMVKPYFHQEDFPFQTQRQRGIFQFGRISRGDADKFNKYQLKIYEEIKAPVTKKGLILGWDKRANKKLQRQPPKWIDALPECQISQQDFYEFCDVLIMTADTFENLPRIGFEAMSSGSVLIVDKRGGWKLQVEDGKTGYLCSHPDEFVYRATRLAYERNEKEDMRQAAKEKLTIEWGIQGSMDSWTLIFEEWQKLR